VRNPTDSGKGLQQIKFRIWENIQQTKTQLELQETYEKPKEAITFEMQERNHQWTV